MSKGNPHPTGHAPFTKEDAKDFGRRGGLASGRAKQERKNKIHDIAEAKPRLLSELVSAAYGEREWSRLQQKDRLAALIKAVEYAHGKPINAKPEEKDNGSFVIE